MFCKFRLKKNAGQVIIVRQASVPAPQATPHLIRPHLSQLKSIRKKENGKFQYYHLGNVSLFINATHFIYNLKHLLRLQRYCNLLLMWVKFWAGVEPR